MDDALRAAAIWLLDYVGPVGAACGSDCDGPGCSTCKEVGAIRLLARHVLSQGWQPIESAPKDGTHILVGQFNRGPGFGHCGKPPAPQYWQAVVHWFDTGTEQGFWLSNGGDTESVDKYATHWMKLPEPPKEQT